MISSGQKKVRYKIIRSFGLQRGSLGPLPVVKRDIVDPSTESRGGQRGKGASWVGLTLV